jgi:hypothetical protein
MHVNENLNFIETSFCDLRVLLYFRLPEFMCFMIKIISYLLTNDNLHRGGGGGGLEKKIFCAMGVS